MNKELNKKIAVIDLDSLAYVSFHPNKVLDEFGIPVRKDNKFVYSEKTEEEIIASVDSCMHYVLSNSGATHYIGYIKGSGNYRYAIDENYKENRSKESPKHWELVKRVFIENWKAVGVNDIEVDDSVNITYRNLEDSFIAAIDGDLLKLETIGNRPHFNWRKKEWFIVSKQEAELKFWKDMITGQSGDNIKGLKGKGVKFAEKLLVGDCELFDTLVSDSYRQVYKDFVIASKEYNKNYHLLKILDSHESFIIPNPIEYKKEEINIFEL